MSEWQSMAGVLMAERYGRLIARARMLGVSGAQAEDLVQDALIATFSKPRAFATVPAAEQYVRRAIVTVYLNSATRGAREQQRWLRVAGSEAEADHAESVDARMDVAAVLATLAPRVRSCVALRYLEDLSITETAHQLGLTEGAVKRYVSDGLKVLNARYGLAATADDSDRAAVTSATKEAS